MAKGTINDLNHATDYVDSVTVSSFAVNRCQTPNIRKRHRSDSELHENEILVRSKKRKCGTESDGLIESVITQA